MTTGSARFESATIRTRLIGVLTAIVIAPVVVLGLASVAAFDRAVEPELVNRTRLIGTIVRGEIQRGLDLGIPIDSMIGLDTYLVETLDRFAEVDRISVTSLAGAEIAQVERPEPPTQSLLERAGFGEVVALSRTDLILPIVSGNELVGEILVETNPRFVEVRLRNVILDVVVIALVATLVALELALAVAVGTVGKPLDRVLIMLGEQRDGSFLHRIRSGGLSSLARAADRLNDHAIDLAERLVRVPAALRDRIAGTANVRIAGGLPERLRLSDFNDIRLALFLLSLVTEVAASFLPLYAGAATRPAWVSAEIAAAAPLILYLLAMALLSPFSGPLTRRFGPRRLFLGAVPPIAIALVGMGLADSLIAISLWRGVIAAAYALATVACQEYALRSAAQGSGARAAGASIAVIYGGSFCGTAMGGVIAGRFGIAATFFTGAAVALLAGALAMAVMTGRAGESIPDNRSPVAGRSASFRFSPSFLVLLVGVAVPMNATAVVFIWYLTPLTLASLGLGPTEIARVIMLYYIAVILIGPTVARLADSGLGPAPSIVAGALLSGLALLSLMLWSGVWALTLAVAGVGIGHTLIRTPQYAMAISLEDPARSLSILRFLERIGALIGLAAVAIALDRIGAETSLKVLGLIVLTGAVIFAIVEFRRKRLN